MKSINTATTGKANTPFITRLNALKNSVLSLFIAKPNGPLLISTKPFKEIILKPEFDCPKCGATHKHGHRKDWIRCYGCAKEFSPWEIDAIEIVPATQQDVDTFNASYRAIETHLHNTQSEVHLSLGTSDFSIRMHHASTKRPVYIYRNYIETLDFEGIDTLCNQKWAKEGKAWLSPRLLVNCDCTWTRTYWVS